MADTPTSSSQESFMIKTSKLIKTLIFFKKTIIVFSNIHSCSISTIYNDNVTLATDDIIFDNVPMCSWPTSLTRAHWTEQPKSKKKEPLLPFKTFCLMLPPCYWITKWPSVSFFEQNLFNYFSFHLSAGYRFAHRHLLTILQVCKKMAW